MDNQFFPNDEGKLSFVMRIYEEEINNRNDWIKENAIQLVEASKTKSASIVISYAMSIINHAMLVLRLVDEEAIGARQRNNEHAKAVERAKILRERNPEFPEPPESLRAIRNDYEHFEARLDQWATSENPNMFIDLNVGSMLIPQSQNQETFRQLEGTTLKFWNNTVDLQEVLNWVDGMSQMVIKNNRERF
ncbi:hypothetical protein AM500_21340 [Bacillus sp. FJAT-18017]|uniref:hypothetical protein n=1 Tax=Bacillus sp. FJAT-18017 TaxID=1705566 RepID=UPI0006B01567|nr:hypothetical protein [Bacillus sp. FJAT-18017]ALC92054.1 hypothetical protein AM500_21340 [Bacillus sp. FJAT-18017]